MYQVPTEDQPTLANLIELVKSKLSHLLTNIHIQQICIALSSLFNYMLLLIRA